MVKKVAGWLLLVVIVGTLISSGCASKGDYNTLLSEKEQVLAEKTQLVAQLGDCQKENQDLYAVYPPKHFSTYSELENWVTSAVRQINTAGLLWDQHAELQRLALEDGYIWSFMYNRDTSEVVSCVFAGDSIYYVWTDGYIEWVGWVG